MGAGKSSVGKRLAKQLRKKFYDCDKAIEQRTGVTITTIFELEGEQGFRQREKTVLQELVAVQNAVIATGGGAVLLPENLLLLKQNNIVIYLEASVASQIKRTSHDKKRPLLQTKDRHATLQNLAKTRNPLYEEIADITIDTDSQSINSSIELITAYINNINI